MLILQQQVNTFSEFYITHFFKLLDQGFSTGVPRDVARGSARDRNWKKKHRFLNLLAKINRSTEKHHSLLKRALTVIIALLYLQLTEHANVPWAVDIIIFMQGFPQTWKLFQGFLQGKKIEKGCVPLKTRSLLRQYSTCKLRWHQYKKTDDLLFSLIC
jgi:hypothetical protein